MIPSWCRALILIITGLEKLLKGELKVDGYHTMPSEDLLFPIDIEQKFETGESTGMTNDSRMDPKFYSR